MIISSEVYWYYYQSRNKLCLSTKQAAIPYVYYESCNTFRVATLQPAPATAQPANPSDLLCPHCQHYIPKANVIKFRIYDRIFCIRPAQIYFKLF